jgi:uncharacterized Tic20 family protein
LESSKILKILAVFFFGLSVGGFGAVTVVREAIPLKDHAWMIAITLACTIPILAGLIVWYLRVVNTCRQLLGPKGGEMINSILTFQLVSNALLILILMSIFFAAIV